LEDNLIGLRILGDKRSGGIYTLEDLNTFSLLANQAALAVENALLYGNMEEQVMQRTKELMEVQKQLVQAEKLATVGTLAGGVAHEINNPLTAILTNVQMLLASGGQADAKLDKESLQLIEEATKRCRTIVQKLMAYSKKPLEAANVTELDLLKVVNNVVSLLGYQLEQENIKVIIDSEESSYLVTGNQNELEQVITNIILNAKDAIKRIRKNGTINVSFSQKGGQIYIKIKDDGAGIPKEIISKIFDPFFTTKDVGKGLGLGLSICQAIVEKHNGFLTVQSEINNGSTFTIQLPKAKIEKKAKSEYDKRK
jgi:C4-dicarboxylate-specific signal transduction histidine kinase